MGVRPRFQRLVRPSCGTVTLPLAPFLNALFRRLQLFALASRERQTERLLLKDRHHRVFYLRDLDLNLLEPLERNAGLLQRDFGRAKTCAILPSAAVCQLTRGNGGYLCPTTAPSMLPGIDSGFAPEAGEDHGGGSEDREGCAKERFHLTARMRPNEN